ncbi:MAG: Asp23/Gls24 family envelope stress response protein [Clostridiales bacterium]|nr:Asp23/Gls24 family envelope stress response protein [Clostridiales bacterium]
MTDSHDNDIGGLIISEDVIASIACNAAKDVEGFSSFSNRPVDIVSTIKKGSLKVTSPVRIIDNGDDLTINIYINIKPGVKINPVAEGIQVGIKEAIQTMTGKIVSKVNVVVAGIDFGPAEEIEPLQTEN